MLAVGLSAGFLLKQSCRKSFPSGDRLSGIGGSTRSTLNIAAGCCITEIQNFRFCVQRHHAIYWAADETDLHERNQLFFI
jgi:hypothetical protein